MSQDQSAGLPASFSHLELDNLRFVAFCLVYLRHAPILPMTGDFVVNTGAMGVYLFFLLSAYLIVSLLLREYRRTGAVDIQKFAARRVLRIWPLYFLDLAAAIVLAHVLPASFPLPGGKIAALTFLAANFYIARHGFSGSPLDVMWSLSVEEQFYLFVPTIAKLGGDKALRRACWIAIACSYGTLGVLAYRRASPHDTVFSNSLVSFQFFAAGGLLAIYLDGKKVVMPLIARVGCAAAAVFLFYEVYLHGNIQRLQPLGLRLCPAYAAVLIGVILVFFAFIDYPARPRSTIGWLGVISYGLYVFHPWALLLAGYLFRRAGETVWQNIAVAAAGLLLSIGFAAISYRHFERPILRYKRRFEVIPAVQSAA